jgi:hypothetical protein
METKKLETKRGNPWTNFTQNYTIADDTKERRLRIAYKVNKQTKSIKKKYNNDNKADIMQQMLIMQRNLIHKLAP